MTDVPANNIPVSVDYTGRDYYSIRQELITRVREATNQKWQGNDPADFGLALIEAFSYMGDQINYYIDRIANETYLLTATQRQSLLNIAQSYGYTPTGYVGSVVDVTLTSSVGSENQIGGSIIGSQVIDGTTVTNVAKLILPNKHPFTVGSQVIIAGMAQEQYNGTWTVIFVGQESGKNVICFKPQSSISSIVGNGTAFTVTTSAEHQFSPGEAVVISGVTPSAYNGNWTILATPTTTTFTVTSALTNSYTSGGIVNYQNLATGGDGSTVLGYAYEVGYTPVPAGTQLSADVTYGDKTYQVMFTTTVDAEVGHIGNPYNSRTIQARQGENVAHRAANRAVAGGHDIDGELLGYGTGEANQTFKLTETAVDKAFLEVYVDSGTNFNKWQQVQHLTDYGPTAAVYSVEMLADNSVHVTFGDGVSGAIPPKDNAIKAVYYAGGGPIGNVTAGLIKTIVAVPTAGNVTVPGVSSAQLEAIIRSLISVTNDTAAYGGSEPETNDVIRFNAPRTLSTLNRAVTLEDFGNLALSMRGVGKAKATAETRTSVTVYIAPSQSDNTTDSTPGVDIETGLELASTTILRQNVAQFLSDKKQIGTTVTIGYPTYVPIALTVRYTPLPQYTNAQVESYLKSTLFSKFSYNYVDFADVITPEEIEFKLRQVEGVRNVRVTAFHRAGGSGRSSAVGADNEIFYFLESNLTLETAPTEARLSNLVIGAGGTISRTFDADVTEYSVAVSNGTASVNVTPTLWDATNAQVTVNNAVVSSGAPTAVATAVGSTVVVVSVTAGDGVTVRNYKLTFSRTS